MTNQKSVNRKVTSIKGNVSEDDSRMVVREVPLTIVVNERELITLLTTGDANRELTLGFLLSEGFLKNREDLREIQVDEETGTARVRLSGDVDLVEKLWGKRAVTSGCGKGATFYHLLDSLQASPVASCTMVTPAQVYGLMRELNRRSDLYRQTHGVHNCALAEKDRILVFKDDIGRHNAVDKIRGVCFVEDIPLGGKIIVTTGRISSEIVVKVAKMGIPILISRSAPTSLALELADSVGLTLIGYVRRETMIVYSGRRRVNP